MLFKLEDSNCHSKLSDMNRVILNIREVGTSIPSSPVAPEEG